MSAAPAALPDWARRLWVYRFRYVLVYLALAASPLVVLRRAYQPRVGFSSLIWFGEPFAAQRLQRLDDVPVYTMSQSEGYDGQFYAQMAVAPTPLDRSLETALDAPGYRERRALLPVVAHILGLGQPWWVLQIYAIANVYCWLLLAGLLARWWFPPTGLHNLVRWVGTLFGAGALVSVTRSLTDVPALLVIALAMRCLELNRGRAAVALLAVAGLVRETSVLAAAVLVPRAGTPRRWSRALGAVALCLAPIAIWIGVLLLRYGDLSGAGNFAPPLVAAGQKVGAIAAAWRVRGFAADVRGDVWAVIALATQVAFFFARPRPADPWWRLGAPFAGLVLVLGGAVWGGVPSAVTRVVLPLTLAFNVLAPRSRRGLALLVAGNLTVLSAANIIAVPRFEQTRFARRITCSYAAGWNGPEHTGGSSWRWASGASRAVIRFHNPGAGPAAVTLEFQLASVGDRQVVIHAPGTTDRVRVQAGPARAAVRVGPFALPPGDADVTFDSAEPPWTEPGADGRRLTFSVHDLSVR